jgi:pimeloyl-ACP methyl ester carboxylesterase
MAAGAMRKLRTWQDKIATDVLVIGSGPPLLYLHGPWGLGGDRAFLDLLAATHTVYAPKHPGTSDGDPDAVHEVHQWWDLILYYGELLDRLELQNIVVVGHSFGGLVACEIAAAMPARVNRLIVSPEDLRAALFADPTGEAAQKFFSLPSEPAARIEAQVGFVWSQACTGKFVWPIPDKGLKRHIHRLTMPALIIWGKADGVIAPAYADEFSRRIANARVVLVDGAGHMPHLEKTEAVAGLVQEFVSA